MNSANTMKTIFTVLITLVVITAFSQEKNHEIRGYLSAIHTSAYNDFFDEWSAYNNLNNRINAYIWLNAGLSISLELQNRLFYGDWFETFPDFESYISPVGDFFNMSYVWNESGSSFIQSRVDRLYFDFSSGKIAVRGGRQRINWGQTLVWSINDIFNNSSFFNLYNIEQYGCDAFKVSLHPSPVSVIETAVKINALQQITWAMMTRFNHNEIDYQIQSGIVDQEDWLLATGVTAEMRNINIRAESAYYLALKKNSSNKNTILLNAGVDYMFDNRIIIQGEILYNQLYDNDFEEDAFSVFTAPKTPKKLSFSEWNYSLNFIYPVSARLNLHVSSVYFVSNKGVYLSPVIDLLLGENLYLNGQFQYLSLDYHGTRNVLVTGTIGLQYYF